MLGEFHYYVVVCFFVGLGIGILIGKYREREHAERAKLDEAFNVAITNTIEQPLGYVEEQESIKNE